MRNYNLGTKGLTMSEAQSITNLMTQRIREIDRNFIDANNSTKTVFMDGRTYVIQDPHPLPTNTAELLKEKATITGALAYLREHVKAKDTMLQNNKTKNFESETLVHPEQPNYITPEIKPLVEEEWGWEQLTAEQYGKYLSDEATAAHIGKFIHKDGVLDDLRNDLKHFTSTEWKAFRVGAGTQDFPVTVKLHETHSAQQLHELHEKLAKQHRDAEKNVNFIKAQVKDSVTLENATRNEENGKEYRRVALINEGLRTEYNELVKKFQDEWTKDANEFATKQLEETKRLHQLKIYVSEIFWPTVKSFYDKLL